MQNEELACLVDLTLAGVSLVLQFHDAIHPIIAVSNSRHCSLFLQLTQKMSTLSAASVEAAAVPESTEKKPLKPCCACPETKKVRDAW